MPKNYRNLLLVFLGLSSSFFAVRANNGIAVALIDYRLDSTVNVDLGYTLTISAHVQNTDTVNFFSGVLDFGVRNTQYQDLSGFGIFKKPPYSADSVILAPGETVPAVFSIRITDPYFIPGPDVVVVWPIANQPVTDSIVIFLDVAAPVTIQHQQQDDFGYYVSGNRIVLVGQTNNITFKQVRIFGINGQLLFVRSAPLVAEIPIPELPHGMYLCEMLTADNQRRVIRFVR